MKTLRFLEPPKELGGVNSLINQIKELYERNDLTPETIKKVEQYLTMKSRWV